MGVLTAKVGLITGASGTSRLLGAAKLQSAPAPITHVRYADVV